MKQRIVDDSVQLEPLPQDPRWPEPTTMTEQIIPDVAATTYDIPSPTHTPTTDEQTNWTVVLRAFSNKSVADYLDAKPPAPTHDGQAGCSDLHPLSLSKCPAGAAETQTQSQPIKHKVDNMCDSCRSH